MTRHSLFLAVFIAISLACFSNGGCGRRTTVVYEQAPPPPPPRTVVVYQQAPPPPPPQQTVVVYQAAPPPPPPVVWEDDEVNYVVYREYYGCSEEEVVALPHYRRYYYLTDENIFFLFFVARHAHVPFDVVFHEYHDNCGRDYNRVVVAYRLDPAIFFVNIPPQTQCPPVYARPYACYRSRQFTGVAFTGDEYHALIALKIGVEYQGHPPEVFFNHVRAGSPPTRVVYQTKENLGKGHIACGGAPVRPVTHPWQMPPQERSNWRAGIEVKRTANEPTFRQQHQEQIQSVQKTQAAHGAPSAPAGKGHEGEPPREPGREGPSTHAAPNTPRETTRKPEPASVRPEANPGNERQTSHPPSSAPAKPVDPEGRGPHDESGHKPAPTRQPADNEGKPARPPQSGERPAPEGHERTAPTGDSRKPSGKDHEKSKDEEKP